MKATSQVLVYDIPFTHPPHAQHTLSLSHTHTLSLSLSLSLSARSQIELLKDENKFLKAELSNSRVLHESSALAVARAREESSELGRLRVEVTNLRVEVGDGRGEAAKRIGTRRGFWRYGNAERERQKPTPSPPATCFARRRFVRRRFVRRRFVRRLRCNQGNQGNVQEGDQQAPWGIHLDLCDDPGRQNGQQGTLRTCAGDAEKKTGSQGWDQGILSDCQDAES